LTLNDRALQFLPLRIFCHSIFNFNFYFLILILNFSNFNFLTFTYFSFLCLSTLCYRILYISPSYTFYTIFHSLYIILLLRHSICFTRILYDMLHILIRYLLYILDVPILNLYFSSNSGGSNKLPDDGRLLPKHVGANT
jgi:hypothetical protein